MPSVLTFTTCLSREEGGGGLIRKGGLLKIFQPADGGLIREGVFTVYSIEHFYLRAV